MSHFRRLSKDLIAYGIMGGISKSVSLILLPLLTHIFSPEKYGIIDIIATMTSLLALFIALSLESAVARLWYEKEKQNKQGQLVFSLLSTLLIFGAVVVLVCWFQSGLISRLLFGTKNYGNYILLGALAALFTALLSIPMIALRMKRNILLYNMVSISQTVLYVGLTVLFVVVYHSGLNGVFISQVVAMIIAVFVGFFLIREDLKFNFSLTVIKESLNYSLPLFPAVGISWMNKQADRIILLSFLGLSVVGVFGAASKIVALISLVIGIFRKAWDPFAISLIDEGSEYEDIYRRGLNYYSGVMTIFALVLVTFSKDILAILVPAQYVHGYVVIPWLVGAVILHGSASFTNLGMMISKKTFGNSKSAFIGAIINTSLGIALIPFIGIWGAAIGSFISEFIFTTLLMRFSKKEIGIWFNSSKLLYIILCYIIASIMVILSNELISINSYSLLLRSIILIVSGFLIAKLILDDAIKRYIQTIRAKLLG